jgi:hypothetical protein
MALWLLWETLSVITTKFFLRKYLKIKNNLYYNCTGTPLNDYLPAFKNPNHCPIVSLTPRQLASIGNPLIVTWAEEAVVFLSYSILSTDLSVQIILDFCPLLPIFQFFLTLSFKRKFLNRHRCSRSLKLVFFVACVIFVRFILLHPSPIIGNHLTATGTWKKRKWKRGRGFFR